MPHMIGVSLALLLQAVVPAHGLREEMCIPDAAVPEAVFGINRNEIAVRPDGHIYVAPDLGQHVLHFDGDGRLVQLIGRAGEGPGEFRMPFRIGLLGDSLWVYDPSLARITLFRPDGTFGRLLATQDRLLRLGTRFLAHGVFGDGRIVGAPTYRMGRRGGAGLIPVMAVSPSLGGPSPSVDTLALVFEADVRFQLTIPNGPTLIGASEIDESSLWMPGPRGDGLVIIEQAPSPGADPSRYTLRVLDGRGNRLAEREVMVRPVLIRGPVEEGIYRRLAQRLWSTAQNQAEVGLAAWERAVRSSLPLPERHPPATRLIGGYDGTIWVQRELPGVPPVRWDVFSPEGEPLGVVHVAEGVTIEKANRDKAWGIRRDRMGVPSLCRFRVEVVERPGHMPGGL